MGPAHPGSLHFSVLCRFARFHSKLFLPFPLTVLTGSGSWHPAALGQGRGKAGHRHHRPRKAHK